jgi:hypothetical protein
VDVESPAVFVIGEVVGASKMLRAAADSLITAC